MTGVAPGAYVFVKAGGAWVCIPRLILAKGGMAVLVSKEGEVIVPEPSCQNRRAAQKAEGGDKKEKKNGVHINGLNRRPTTKGHTHNLTFLLNMPLIQLFRLARRQI